MICNICKGEIKNGESSNSMTDGRCHSYTHRCVESLTARLASAEAERNEWRAACQTQFKVNVDSPLFSGLAGGSFGPGVLLASLHAVTAERNEARTAARWLYATTNNYRQFDAEERWPWIRDDAARAAGGRE